jgi:hypothetical protein
MEEPPIGVGERLERIENLLSRLVTGLDWYLTPEDSVYPKELGRHMTTPKVSQERLIELRPTVYLKGWNAFHEDKAARRTNPYTSTRGGYRNAWFRGWDDAEAGLDRRRESEA